MNQTEAVSAGRRDALILLADEAERIISKSLARESGSEAPSMDRAAGEIDMAFVLKLIDYARRDALMGQLREIVNNRRRELHQQHTDRLLMRNQV